MIKKFIDFTEAKMKDIYSTLTPEVIDDNTLRLVEIMGCSVSYEGDTMRLKNGKNYPIMKILISSRSEEKSKEIFMEVFQIKSRLELMFPVNGKMILEKWLEQQTRNYSKIDHVRYRIAYVIKFRLID